MPYDLQTSWFRAFNHWVVFYGVYVLYSHCSFVGCRTLRLFPFPSNCEQDSNKQDWARTWSIWSWVLWTHTKEWYSWVICRFLFSFLWIHHTNFHGGASVQSQHPQMWVPFSLHPFQLRLRLFHSPLPFWLGSIDTSNMFDLQFSSV